jgi:hypothetical protein
MTGTQLRCLRENHAKAPQRYEARGENMTRNRLLVAVAAVTTAVAMSVVGAMTASADVQTESHANQLAGTWDMTIDRPAPLSDPKSLMTFIDGGSSIEIANIGTALRSPSHGAWQRLEGREYATTTVFFRYDPQSGAYLGTQKNVGTITLSPDGNSFSGSAVSTIYDPDGNVVITGLVAGLSAVRIEAG